MAGQWMFTFVALAVSASVAAAPDASGQRRSGNAGQQSATGNGDRRSADTTAVGVVQRGREAFSGIVAAERAIDRKDAAAAKTQLARARKILDDLYASSRGADVVKEIDRVQTNLAGDDRRVDFAPLNAIVSSRATYLAPDVTAGIVDDAVRLKQQAHGGTAVDASQLSALATRTLTLGAHARATAANGERHITGHVANATGDHIVIDGKTQGMVTLKVGDATKITVEGHATRADQIQPGSPVFAAYEGGGHDLTATRVRVDPPRMSSGDASTGSPSDVKPARETRDTPKGNGATTAK